MNQFLFINLEMEEEIGHDVEGEPTHYEDTNVEEECTSSVTLDKFVEERNCHQDIQASEVEAASVSRVDQAAHDPSGNSHRGAKPSQSQHSGENVAAYKSVLDNIYHDEYKYLENSERVTADAIGRDSEHEPIHDDDED